MMKVLICSLLATSILTACRGDLPTEPTTTAAISLAESAPQQRRRAVARLREIRPTCSAPAPLIKADCRAGGYIVGLRQGIDVAAETAALETKYGFKASYVGVANPFFIATLSLNTVAALRCESVVTQIDENAIGTVGGVPSPCG